jgi:diguanylate cyclase (GGDEF)-like protein/PAS domain S-box-containing protein
VKSKQGQQTPPLILVAEGDRDARVAICDALKASGFVVEEAEDGLQAISAFLRLRPEVVILDVEMPQLDGFEVCAALRRIAPCVPVPILMLAGRQDGASISRAHELGATDFATKPVNVSLLGHRLRYLLGAAETLTELRRSETLRAAAQRAAQMGHWEWDVAAHRFFWSPEVHQIFGTAPDEFQPTLEALLSRIPQDERPRVSETFAKAEREGTGFTIEHRVERADGVRVVVQEAFAIAGERSHLFVFLGTVRDVTSERSAEAEIHFLEHFDPLTRLPNRSLFLDWLDQAAARVSPDGVGVTVFILNLDAFKRINESLGHGSGDRLLQSVADRLLMALEWTPRTHRAEILDQDKILSHPGGDEFFLGLRGIRGHEATQLAQRLLEALARPFTLDGREVVVTGCVGISMQPAAGQNSTSLMRAAETALHEAKRKGWGSYGLFTRSARTPTLQRLDTEVGLRRALERNELTLHFQPQVDTQRRVVVGVEALVRWNHPVRGLLGPGGFLQLAEETDLILPLGEWVLREACTQAVAWHAAGADPVVVAVNVSSRQFSRPDLAGDIRNILSETRLPPERLELEITESALMQNVSEAASLLGELQSMGVRVAIDDFGTGYSSLSYLKRLPIQTLKIDQSFVRGVANDSDNAAITATIIVMAHRLNLDVVAEGVENRAEYSLLRDQGCRVMQGFLFARPLETAKVLDFLKAGLPDHGQS